MIVVALQADLQGVPSRDHAQLYGGKEGAPERIKFKSEFEESIKGQLRTHNKQKNIETEGHVTTQVYIIPMTVGY